MATVSFEQVHKRFGSAAVVQDLNLQVADGELLILLGGSGCGKSTTLRMLAGLESVSAGTIRIGDRDVTRLPPRERDVAMVFQDYALYPHLTARENIALGLQLRRVASAEIARRVRWAVDLLGLGEVLDRRPKDMSGGQRQRVAMGRAMVREPAVFLFDEPLSNLDAQLRGQVRVEIARLQRRLGTTALYVTHDQVEAMTLGDRLVVLDAGRVQQIGRPMDIYRAPANRFVAGFLGSPPMNFFAGALRAEGEHLYFEGDGLRVALPPSLRPSCSAGRDVTLGVRAEDLSVVSATAGHEGHPTLRGLLLQAERLGSATHLHVEVGAQRVIAAVGSDLELASAAPIVLSLAPERIHLFGPDGEAWGRSCFSTHALPR